MLGKITVVPSFVVQFEFLINEKQSGIICRDEEGHLRFRGGHYLFFFKKNARVDLKVLILVREQVLSLLFIEGFIINLYNTVLSVCRNLQARTLYLVKVISVAK